MFLILNKLNYNFITDKDEPTYLWQMVKWIVTIKIAFNIFLDLLRFFHYLSFGKSL